MILVGGKVGTGVAGALNTFAYQRNNATVSIATNLRNNIFVNNRSNGAGTGVHYAVGFTTAMTTALTSDHNLFLTNGTGGSLGLMGATPYSTLATWKTGTSKDAASLYGDPQFEDATGNATNVDLHLNSTVATPAEAAGFDVGILVGSTSWLKITAFDNVYLRSIGRKADCDKMGIPFHSSSSFVSSGSGGTG